MVCNVVVVANRSQQVVTAGINPRAVYSRTVNLYLYIAAGLGIDDWQITPPLGNSLWLQEVSLTCMPNSVVNKGQAFIYINAGSGKNVSRDDVLNMWRPVIPNYGSAKPGFQFYGLQQRFVWPMNKRYTGEALRFGCVVASLSATVAMRFWISFTFSEG